MIAARGAQGIRFLVGLKALAGKHTADDLEAACERLSPTESIDCEAFATCSGLGKSLDKLVQVRLTDTTLEAVLTEGLKQVDFQYTLGVTGIRLTTRESPE